MTINTERLKTDAAYWDECGAPEDAAHYCPLSKLFYDDNYPIAPCCIPRPTKPSAPEWDGDGFPPVGCECEVDDRVLGGWNACSIKWIGREVVVVDRPDGGELCVLKQSRNFRPIPTKAQRDRDELAEVIAVACTLKADIVLSDCQHDHIAEAILSRYTMERKK